MPDPSDTEPGRCARRATGSWRGAGRRKSSTPHHGPTAAVSIAVLAASVFYGGTVQADWRMFRGTDTTAVAVDAELPTEWNGRDGEEQNIAWKVPLPGQGLSSPIVVGNKVIVTASSGFSQDRLHVLCFDAESGDELWHRQFYATGSTTTHRKTRNAAPTPASDGERVFATFSSNDVICLDLKGNLQWLRGLTYDFPNASNSLGMASSPVVIGDTLVVQAENDSQSIATGLDTATGLSRWVTDRPRMANWTSPVIADGGNGGALALLQSGKGVAAFQPRSGNVVWEFEDGAATIPSSAVTDGLVAIPSNGITTLRLTAGSSNPEKLWNNGALSPSTSSPVIFEGRIYSISRTVLTCADLETGERVWQLRLSGAFSGSPVIAGGKLYVFSESGDGIVVDLKDDAGEIVATNPMGESILATPAVSDNAMYIRSDGHLWKIAKE